MSKAMKRPKSSKLNRGTNHLSPYQEQMMLNKMIKTYYKDYEQLKHAFKIEDYMNTTSVINQKDYSDCYKKVQSLFEEWKEPADFCVAFSEFDQLILTERNRLDSNTLVKQDYERRRKCRMSRGNSEVNLRKDLKEIRENSKSDDDEVYKDDFNVNIDENEIMKSHKEDKDDMDGYGFDNDYKEVNESEEYKFNEEDKKIVEQMNNQQNSHNDNHSHSYNHSNNEHNEKAFPLDNNNISDEFEKKSSQAINNKPEEQHKFISNPKPNQHESHNNSNNKNQSNSIDEDFNQNNYKAQTQKIRPLSATNNINNNSSNNSLIKTTNIPIQTAPFALRTSNNFFLSTNDKFLLDDFESKVFSKEHNILPHPSTFEPSYYDLLLISEKKSIIIQRQWKKHTINKYLNKQRPFLHCQWDKTNKYIILIFSDHTINTSPLAIIHILFIRLYSIVKMKTSYDLFTIKDLKELDVIDSNSGDMTMKYFSKIKQELSERIVELVIEQNAKTQQMMNYDTLLMK